MTGSVQQGLEAECTHLRTQFAQCQKEHDTLLAACALLSGALYPMYVRYTELASQRQLLVDQLSNFATFKHQIQALVEALSGDGLRNQKNSRGTGLGLLRFRKGVLAVIVANRLANASQSNCRMFSTTDALPGVYNMLVCSGYVEPITKKFSGESVFVDILVKSCHFNILAIMIVILKITMAENNNYRHCYDNLTKINLF